MKNRTCGLVIEGDENIKRMYDLGLFDLNPRLKKQIEDTVPGIKRGDEKRK
jgi:hypothetical protein